MWQNDPVFTCFWEPESFMLPEAAGTGHNTPVVGEFCLSGLFFGLGGGRRNVLSGLFVSVPYIGAKLCLFCFFNAMVRPWSNRNSEIKLNKTKTIATNLVS